MISVDKLGVDYSYQRVLRAEGRSNIRKIVEGFDWRHFQPLLVARHGEDRYVIIDGQHRAIAAALHPDVRSIPCAVVDCGFDEQARIFVEINTQVVRMSSLEMFWARFHAGATDAFAAASIIHAVGMSVSKDVPKCSYSSDGDYDSYYAAYSGKIWKPMDVLKCANRHGWPETTFALNFIIDGEDDPVAANSALLPATTMAFKKAGIEASMDEEIGRSFADHHDIHSILAEVAERNRNGIRTDTAQYIADEIVLPFIRKWLAP